MSVKSGDLTQIREVACGGGFLNPQASRIVHFGLGKRTGIDEITLRWVGGTVEKISGIQPNQRYLVIEGSGKGIPYQP